MRQLHFHLRKRISKALEPYPARTPWKRFLDATVFAAGIIGPIFAIPQVLLIYGSQDASGISAVSWFGWAALDIPWILYGIAHRERPIVITYSMWMVLNTIVATGAVLYGGK